MHIEDLIIHAVDDWRKQRSRADEPTKLRLGLVEKTALEAEFRRSHDFRHVTPNVVKEGGQGYTYRGMKVEWNGDTRGLEVLE